MAPHRNKGGGTERPQEGSTVPVKDMYTGAGEPEGVPLTPHSYGRDGGGFPPHAISQPWLRRSGSRCKDGTKNNKI